MVLNYADLPRSTVRVHTDTFGPLVYLEGFEPSIFAPQTQRLSQTSLQVDIIIILFSKIKILYPQRASNSQLWLERPVTCPVNRWGHIYIKKPSSYKS